MKVAILVTGSPHRDQAAHSAWQFAAALLKSGHIINCLFLQGDAAFLATAPQDGTQALTDDARNWGRLVLEWELPATVCAGSARDRALEDHCLRSGWRIGGLGDWVMASQDADRILQFTGSE